MADQIDPTAPRQYAHLEVDPRSRRFLAHAARAAGRSDAPFGALSFVSTGVFFGRLGRVEDLYRWSAQIPGFTERGLGQVVKMDLHHASKA